jgi:hypothetical protein
LRKTPERKIRSAKLLSLVEKLAWSEMRDIVQDADVVVDQFTTGAYGTLSCEAMAAGRPVVANLGNDVFYQEGNNERSMFLARLPMLILTMLFGLVVFAFARDLVGPAGGLVALTLYAFSPDVIAHGSLAGVGMPVAGFLLTMLWLLWRGRRRPYVYLPLGGVALGAAVASKMSALPAVPVAMLLTVVSVWYAGCARATGARLDRRRVVRLLLAGAGAAVGVAAIGVLTVWAVYLVVDPRLRWSTPPGLPVLHGRTGQLVSWLPFPEPFRDGMRLQLARRIARR